MVARSISENSFPISYRVMKRKSREVERGFLVQKRTMARERCIKFDIEVCWLFEWMIIRKKGKRRNSE